MEDRFLLTKVEAVGQLLDRDFKLPGIDRIRIELDLAFHDDGNQPKPDRMPSSTCLPVCPAAEAS